MAELVDALDLGSSIERCAGSSPVPGTFSRFANQPPKPLKMSGLQLESSGIQPAQSCVKMSQNAPNYRSYCRNGCRQNSARARRGVHLIPPGLGGHTMDGGTESPVRPKSSRPSATARTTPTPRICSSSTIAEPSVLRISASTTTTSAQARAIALFRLRLSMLAFSFSENLDFTEAGH